MYVAIAKLAYKKKKRELLSFSIFYSINYGFREH